MDLLISTQWLSDNIGRESLVILDASRHLPSAGRDPKAEFEAGHIPGARFLDLASLTNAASPVPAALPNASQLAKRLGELGVKAGQSLILYDDSAVKTAARAWFSLKAHGLENVAILDGGFAKWRAEGREIESRTQEPSPAATMSLTETRNVATKADILENLETSVFQLVDARGADRVFGFGTDPVHGGQNGRIPGSLNVPFGQVFDDDGKFKSPTDLREVFVSAGVDLSRPIATTCGSGVTASVLLFALELAGHDNARLYDGSWQEWEADPVTPKSKGPA